MIEHATQEWLLARKAIEQIRDSLVTLSYATDGWYEDEAQVALDALDWIEERLAPLAKPGVP